MPRRLRDPRAAASASAVAAAVRRHWLAAALFGAGLVLRILTQLAYRPAIFYIDTSRYLQDAMGNDPVGYRAPLRLILLIGNLDVVAAIQHLLGLAIAGALYLTLLRRGTPRWLAALAIAPVLLDAYQLQAEQMIMPDIWFEALIVAGIAVLLAGPAISSPTMARIVAAGLILGISATFRQVGEILILPALIYLLALRGGWRRVLRRMAVLAAAFAVPILAYSTASLVVTGHFWLSHSGVTTTYGRMAAAADCATLKLPAIERALCPTPAQRALGPDGLEHSPLSPRVRYYVAPALKAQASSLVARFNHQVLTQQPQLVIAAIARDSVKLFALTRTTSPGDTPISRWQFQVSYPYLAPHATRQDVRAATDQFGGGSPALWRPVAEFLRSYQLNGGYTPGPLLAFCVLAGLAGSILAGLRQRPAGRATARRAAAREVAEREDPAREVRGRQTEPGRPPLALACLLFFGCGAFVLLMSDVFEFSWRYQLPALVTLPPAGVLAVAAFTSRRATGGGPMAERLAESGEEVGLRD